MSTSSLSKMSKSNHWSRHNSSQSSSSSSSWKRKVHSSTTSSQALLHYHQSHYYASGLVLPDHVQSHHLRWSDPQFTTLDKQSASNIIAEIDDKIISDSRKRILEEESQEDLSQQAQVPHCLKDPSTPSSAERELHELTHLPLRSWCKVCQRTKGLQGQHKHQSRKKSSVIQLDHSFYKVPGSVQNLKVLTFIETSTSMCGAVIVPDLSANQVGIKSLKQLTMVNGFTHSVLYCDGHSGLMKLQDQVGKDLSLPTQISPPYSHQSQGTVERFHKTLYDQVRAIKLGLGQVLKTRTVTRLVKSLISSSTLSSSTKSFFPLMNQNLTIKNLKKIESLFRNCSGHSSCNSSQR